MLDMRFTDNDCKGIRLSFISGTKFYGGRVSLVDNNSDAKEVNCCFDGVGIFAIESGDKKLRA